MKYEGKTFNTVNELADFLNENQSYRLISFAKEIKIHAIFVIECPAIEAKTEEKKEVVIEKKKTTRKKKASKK